MQMRIKPVLVGFGIFFAVIAGGAGAGVACLAPAATEGQLPVLSGRKSVSISNNSGGVIGSFALQAAEFQAAGTLVKFSGRCDSACTLFLSLPREQTCIGPKAYFRFHAPSARSSRLARTAQSYMMANYPEWVRSWIEQKGGLSRLLFTMDYAYASRFIPSCETIALR